MTEDLRLETLIKQHKLSKYEAKRIRDTFRHMSGTNEITFKHFLDHVRTCDPGPLGGPKKDTSPAYKPEILKLKALDPKKQYIVEKRTRSYIEQKYPQIKEPYKVLQNTDKVIVGGITFYETPKIDAMAKDFLKR